MERSTGYLKRAWRDLTGQHNWWQPVAILSLVNFIPIVGSMFVNGYLLDWSREAAWGMDRGLPRKVGDAGKRLKWGFFATVVVLCWVLPISIIGAIFSVVPVVGAIIAILANVLIIIAGVIAMAATVRMTIYDRIKGGLQFSRILNMAKQDPNGLARCFFITLLELVPVILGSIAIAMAFAPVLAGLAMTSGTIASTGAVVAAIIGTGIMGCVLAVAISLIIFFFTTVCQALAYRAYGYWMGQFQPEKWGGIEEPMPFEPGYKERAAAAAASNPASEPTAENPTSFEDVKEQAAATAAAAGAFVAEHAQSAADKAGAAASGFKAERVEPTTADEPQVIEVEATVENVEQPAADPEPAAEPVGAEPEPAAEPVGASEARPQAAEEPVGASEARPQAAAEPVGASEARPQAAEEPTQGEKWAAVYREAYEKAHGAAEAKCPTCGANVDDAHKFCTHCGTKLQ